MSEISIFQPLLKTENVIDTFFATESRKRPVILFAAGFALKWRYRQMQDEGFNVVCACDNDKSKHGSEILGLKILSLEDSMRKYPDAIYVIASSIYFDEIKDQLLKVVGLRNVCTIDFDGCRYFRGEQFKAFLAAHLPEFDELYSSLADEQSRTVLYNVVKGLLSGLREDFARVFTDDQYLFDSLMRPRGGETYICGGAYDGGTILEFLEAAGALGYKRIIAFEPDEEYYEKLENTVKTHAIKNVELVKKGTWNTSGQLQFAGGGMGRSVIKECNQSFFAAEVQQTIEVLSIDDYLNGTCADIIKMDIEGAEKNSLIGAEKTIRKYRPRLAICVYHNVEDYIKIPQIIRSFVPEYKLYLRHHGKNCDETVLYAVS